MVFYVLIEEVCAEKFKNTGLILLASYIPDKRLRIMTDLPTPVTPVKNIGFSFSSKSSKQ